MRKGTRSFMFLIILGSLMTSSLGVNQQPRAQKRHRPHPHGLMHRKTSPMCWCPRGLRSTR